MYLTNLISDKQPEKATICDGNVNRKAGMSGLDRVTRQNQSKRVDEKEE
jgi:hypothetical protein